MLSSVKSVSAATDPLPEKQEGQNIGITAVVPLSVEFAYLIEHNSTVTPDVGVVFPGEMARVTVAMRGWKDEKLAGHNLLLVVSDNAGNVILKKSGTSDKNGEWREVIPVGSAFVGKLRVMVTDMTYPASLTIRQEAVIRVVERPKESKNDRKNGKIIVSQAISNEMLPASFVAEKTPIRIHGEVSRKSDILMATGKQGSSGSARASPRE